MVLINMRLNILLKLGFIISLVLPVAIESLTSTIISEFSTFCHDVILPMR